MICTPYSLELTSMLCYWQRGTQVADGMKVANQLILRLGNYSGLSRWAQRIHKNPQEWERKGGWSHALRGPHLPLLILMMEEGARSQSMKASSRSWKRLGHGFSPRVLERNVPY